MKKYFCYFFILLLFIQSGGIVWWLKAEQIAIRQEIREQMAQATFNQYTELNLSLTDYYENLKDGGKELLLNGNLYDIKSVTIIKGKVKIKAIHDTKEQNLLLRLVQFIKHSSSNQKQIPKSLTQLMLLCYLPQQGASIFFLAHQASENVLKQTFAAKTFLLPIDSPPPKLFS